MQPIKLVEQLSKPLFLEGGLGQHHLEKQLILIRKSSQATLAVLRQPLLQIPKVGRLGTQVLIGFHYCLRVYIRPVQAQPLP